VVAIVGRDQVEPAITVSIECQHSIVPETRFVVGPRREVASPVVEEDAEKVLGPVRYREVQVAVSVEVSHGEEDAVLPTWQQSFIAERTIASAGKQRDIRGRPVRGENIEMAISGEIAGTYVVDPKARSVDGLALER